MTDDKLAAALAEIREREQHATPGPWAWFGNTDTHSVYLATRQWGRFIVMGFRRWGTQGARPTFAAGRTWKPAPKSDLDFGPAGRMTPSSEMFTGKGEMTDADSLAVYAVAPDATSRKDPRVYRADLSGIRNPDAEFIASAREDVPRLLAAVDAALARHTETALEIDNPAVPPFSYCRQCAGHPKWPCPEIADILAALTGKAAGDGRS